jgi:hypothetical protein
MISGNRRIISMDDDGSPLASKLGQPVPRATVLKKVYGSSDPENNSKLRMVMKGVTQKIEKSGGRKIKFKQDNIDGETYYTLNA